MAPSKSKLPVPKLELTACLLAVRLQKTLKSTVHAWADLPVVFWSDSTIALAWISHDPSRLPPYVANRVKEIQQHTQLSQWHHIPGKENPADLLTRKGISKSQVQEPFWLEGPSWICDSNNWPECEAEDSSSVPDLLPVLLAPSQPTAEPLKPLFDLSRISSLDKALRVVSYVRRFATKSLRSSKGTPCLLYTSPSPRD